MIVVTGGCGFIGSNLVHGLNGRNCNDILVVDDLTDGEKIKNISRCSIIDYQDYREFPQRLEQEGAGKIEAVFHLGACSDTMERDGQYMMAVNYEYSKRLYQLCVQQGIPFIYASSASVYGDGTEFRESPKYENALNVYAYSKLLFDRFVRNQPLTMQTPGTMQTQVVGLRYFNVYGPREQHKGRMASVAYHFYNQLQDSGHVNLFEGSGGYPDGDQRRDFIYVSDVVDVNLFFLDHPELSGIFNVGTGQCRSFNDMACAVVSATRHQDVVLADLLESRVVRYIPFPGDLQGKYQSYTQASVEQLRECGFSQEFTSLEDGVRQYVRWRQKS